MDIMNSQFLVHFEDFFRPEDSASRRDRVRSVAAAKQELSNIWQTEISRKNAITVLEQTVQVLKSQHLSAHRTVPTNGKRFDLSYLIPQSKLVVALEEAIFHCGEAILQTHFPRQGKGKFDLQGNWSFANDSNFMVLAKELHNVGLWDSQATAAAAAQAVTRLLDFIVYKLCIATVDPTTLSQPASQVIEQIIRDKFEPFVSTLPLQEVPSDRIDYYALASSKLALYRSQDFFEIIQAKDAEASKNEHVLEDIRVCAIDPAARRYLLEELILRLKKELLQPGCATVEILDCFVRAVHRTRRIDPHGSLLNEISKTFRVYVKLRDDAVRIMLLNFLEGCRRDENASTPEWPEYSEGIADSVKKMPEMYSGDYYEGADLRDLHWQPEPVDASFGHQASKNLDDLGHLIKLAEQNVFVSELQLLFRARLLGSAGSEYIQELDLLQMLKRRFNQEGVFQNVDVMLNDVLQSHRLLNEMVDKHKHRARELSLSLDEEMPTDEGEALFSVPFKAHVLSRAYWTNIESGDFKLPDIMQTQMSIFEEKFKALHEQKQLQWSKQLGHVLVELELTDRTFHREVSPAQAAVIARFSAVEATSKSSSAQSCTFQELKRSLEMDEALLRQCLTFWIAQEILVEVGPDTYRVVEDLSEAHSTEQVAAAEASIAMDPHTHDSNDEAHAAPVELKSAAELLRENGLVYGNFIAALLTNQGGMPAPRIHMILKTMMPGGFPFSTEDLVEFLREMATEDEGGSARIESVSGNWRIKKK